MKVLALVNRKGGAGKTTLAASLAVAAAEVGRKVLALDLDSQGSLAARSDERATDNVNVDGLPSDQITRLPSILAALADRFDLVVLDTPGIASATNTPISVADLCLIPARPSRLDTVATWPVVDVMKRPERTFAFVINQALPVRSPWPGEAAAGLGLLGVLAVMVVLRSDFQEPITAGWGRPSSLPAARPRRRFARFGLVSNDG
jgi:chromosome partitioning protein